MNTRISIPALCAFLLTGALVTAQTEVKKTQDPHGQVKDASASKVEPSMPIEFSVSGLTKTNIDKVKTSLTSMESPCYVCEGCKHEQTTAGRCSPCNVDLKEKKTPVFTEAVPSLETGTIRVTRKASSNLSYADLDSALMKNAVQIDDTKFRLPGQFRLVLRGGKLEDVGAIEKAFTDAKLFDKVKADFDAVSGDIVVMVKANATPPLRTQVISLLDGLGTGTKLADIVWGPIPTPAKT